MYRIVFYFGLQGRYSILNDALSWHINFKEISVVEKFYNMYICVHKYRTYTFIQYEHWEVVYG